MNYGKGWTCINLKLAIYGGFTAPPRRFGRIVRLVTGWLRYDAALWTDGVRRATGLDMAANRKSYLLSDLHKVALTTTDV
jgi:hypothetical protein